MISYSMKNTVFLLVKNNYYNVTTNTTKECKNNFLVLYFDFIDSKRSKPMFWFVFIIMCVFFCFYFFTLSLKYKFWDRKIVQLQQILCHSGTSIYEVCWNKNCYRPIFS